MVQRGVAVEDLDEEPVDDGAGGQEAVAPDVTELVADLMNCGWIEMVGQVLPEPVECVINTAMHPGASCLMGRVTTP